MTILVYLAAVPGFAAYLALNHDSEDPRGHPQPTLFVNLLPAASLPLAVLLLEERLAPAQAAGAPLVPASLALAAGCSVSHHLQGRG